VFTNLLTYQLLIFAKISNADWANVFIVEKDNDDRVFTEEKDGVFIEENENDNISETSSLSSLRTEEDPEEGE
jgi:hypothetical protein